MKVDFWLAGSDRSSSQEESISVGGVRARDNKPLFDEELYEDSDMHNAVDR